MFGGGESGALVRRQALIFTLFGFASGLPFLLTLSTLSAWLVESDVTLTMIGLFVLVTCPYSFKFVMSPWVDGLEIPYLGKRLGQRRSWAFVSQVSLMICLIGLGMTNPKECLWSTACMAFLVCLSAALQDLALEAYRMERTVVEGRGVVASALCFGFRLGLMVSGAGALYLASFLPWSTVYGMMAVGVGVGMCAILITPEPRVSVQVFQTNPYIEKMTSLRFFWARGVRQLFKDHAGWAVLAFILIYKLADTVLNVMNVPFLLALGYSKREIAEIAKFFGTSAMILGGFLGGWLLMVRGLWPSLWVVLGLHILSSLFLMVQAWVGYDVSFLVLVVGVENLSSGLSTTVFLAYLGALCKPPYTATQYAFLASVASFSRIMWSIVGGRCADYVPWPTFFFLVALGSLPGFFVLYQFSPVFRRIWNPSPVAA